MKNFLKTGKGKVITALLAVFFITAGGVAFASTAGDNLKDWYEGVFADTTDEAMDEAETHGEEEVDDFKGDYADRKDQKAGQIDRKRDYETGDKEGNIETAKDGHIEDIEGAKEEILKGMELEIHQVYQDAWLAIQARADEAENLLNEDMEQFANAEGGAAIEQLNSDLDQAKDDAVSDLEEAIEDAKAEISAKLEDQGEILEDNLTGSIDHEIQMLQNTVSETLQDLTKQQEELIIAAAEDKEAEAKDALDEVLNDMNN